MDMSPESPPANELTKRTFDCVDEDSSYDNDSDLTPAQKKIRHSFNDSESEQEEYDEEDDEEDDDDDIGSVEDGELSDSEGELRKKDYLTLFNDLKGSIDAQSDQCDADSLQNEKAQQYYQKQPFLTALTNGSHQSSSDTRDCVNDIASPDEEGSPLNNKWNGGEDAEEEQEKDKEALEKNDLEQNKDNTEEQQCVIEDKIEQRKVQWKDGDCEEAMESDENVSGKDDEDDLPQQQYAVLDDLDAEDSMDDMDEPGSIVGVDVDDLTDSDYIDEDEIQQLVEKPTEFVQREKVVLKERGHDPFDILPEGWITVTHNSGMPVYLHRGTRVCTMARPYFLGPASARKHHVPLSAIPCLHYSKNCPVNKELDPFQEDQELPDLDHIKKEDTVDAEPSGFEPVGLHDVRIKEEPEDHDNPEDIVKSLLDDILESVFLTARKEDNPLSTLTDDVTSVQVKTEAEEDTNNEKDGEEVSDESQQEKGGVQIKSIEDHRVNNCLDHDEVRNYCHKRFEFQHITVKRFRTWHARRKHNKQTNLPLLPDGTKVLTVPIPITAGVEKSNLTPRRKQFVLNPKNKSEVCILHEYAQHALRCQPKYTFKETADAERPFSATISINNIIYGVGAAQNKRAAKTEAARETLRVLIPGIVQVKDEEVQEKGAVDLSFFDNIPVEDPRVPELCSKVGQPMPYEILQECLKRNFGLGDTKLHTDIKIIRAQRSEFTLRVAKYHAMVTCRNKREGKQKAAQQILQQMHPFITNWGSLLRLYTKDLKAINEKKAQRLSITCTPIKGKAFEPNHTILNKLKEEMLKLKDKQEAFRANIKCKIEMPAVANKSVLLNQLELH